MQKPMHAVSQGQDAFVNELRQKKYDAGVKLGTKKAELSALERQQRQLTVLLESEKHKNHGSKQKKGKEHDKNKEVRLDIVRNEQKFKEQAGKIELLRKEIQHLEMDLKSLTHDLAVVEQSH